MPITRRSFMEMAVALGAAAAWGQPVSAGSKVPWHERRDLYPEGVASGDPQSTSVLLWTRRAPKDGNAPKKLTMELAENPSFTHVVATADARISEATDWTCRVLVANLKPASVYWYRFTDALGHGSRIGRTITAPTEDDGKPVRFAFVSCQNVQQGASTAYRRMIWEDKRRSPEDRLGFVLHLGDFVYEVVWYPEERPQGMYARKLRDIVRYANGEKQLSFHIPTTVDDYRALYRAYLQDPDLQDARAYFPFVCIWDNHEFSWKGWQTQQNFGSGVIPAQTRKLAACQAWFEYQPARVRKAAAPGSDRFVPPPVKNATIHRFDENGLGLEPGNLAVINSLKLYRTFKWGRNVELILTDNRTFRSEPLGDQPGFAPFSPPEFLGAVPADVVEILDAGRTFSGGHAPETIEYGGAALPNPRKNAPPQSMLGAEQKTWFLEHLRTSSAPWKLWGNTVAMIDCRTDFHNLPAGIGPKWPTAGYALFEDDDWSGYRAERAEILDFVRKERIGGFATLAGDRHAFTAGVLSTSLPPEPFEPMGVEFVTGSISAPGLFEAFEYSLPKDYPLRPIFLHQPGSGAPVQNAMNLSVMHGVRASLALQKTGDLQLALQESNPEVAPHLSFIDTGGHGYSTVRAASDELEVEFVCIPRPIERSESEDGGPLAYRVTHRVKLWKPGSLPRVERTANEGAPSLML
ncbi:MAG TPA: alkaline phosphatase D family protein [Candidatus Acidoferrum sp.]|nr:alkaline phosphatase D family protein [Candidatus Acidoferrum sp.]